MTGFSTDAFRERLVQPDQRSCGATVLVVARMLLDPSYSALLETGTRATRFRHEVLAMHRRVTGVVDASGRLQVPWPRVIGTPPWAVAHQLSTTSGPTLPAVPYGTHAAWSDGGQVYDDVVAATATHRPVAVYVGSPWLPRHVVLFLGEVAGRLRCYDPASGALVDVDRESFAAHRLRLAGWDRPWFVVSPRGPRSRA